MLTRSALSKEIWSCSTFNRKCFLFRSTCSLGRFIADQKRFFCLLIFRCTDASCETNIQINKLFVCISLLRFWKHNLNFSDIYIPCIRHFLVPHSGNFSVLISSFSDAKVSSKMICHRFSLHARLLVGPLGDHNTHY